MFVGFINIFFLRAVTLGSCPPSPGAGSSSFQFLCHYPNIPYISPCTSQYLSFISRIFIYIYMVPPPHVPTFFCIPSGISSESVKIMGLGLIYVNSSRWVVLASIQISGSFVKELLCKTGMYFRSRRPHHRCPGHMFL